MARLKKGREEEMMRRVGKDDSVPPSRAKAVFLASLEALVVARDRARAPTRAQRDSLQPQPQLQPQPHCR